MKKSRRMLYGLTMALGCALAAPSFGEDLSEDSNTSQPVFRPPLIQQTSAVQPTSLPPKQTEAPQPPPEQVPTSRWDAQEPIQTPEQADPLIASGGQYACGAACYDPGCQFIVGLEATFFWPQMSRTFLHTSLTNSLGTQDYINSSALGSADGGLLVAPRLTFGLQGECWGLVGRYWNAANWANGFTPAIPDSPQSGILLFDSFQAYTIDLEVQRRFCWRYWDCFGFVGARYASVNNDRYLWTQNTFGPGPELVEASAFAGQQFNGVGVTFGVFGTRPLFCDDGALRAYFSNRYSVLSGNGAATVQTNARAAYPGSFESLDGALAIGDGCLFIAEVGAGLQWEGCLACLPGRVFFRTGFEWQYWDANTGVAAGAESFADNTVGSASAFTETADLLFDLVGITIGAGITY